MEPKKLHVLDKGFVVLHDVLGTDETVVNAARCSFDKKSDKLTPGDEKLLDFLARNDHHSPYRHATLQFEMYVPMMICRQHWKYVVGSDHTMDAWNESSRRYVTDNEVFYIPFPDEWRSKPENTKQGSGAPVDIETGEFYTNALMDYVETGHNLYEQAMADGIAAEQARLFLPANGLYVRYYWTASLQSVAHMIKQRTASDSQFEFQQVAQAVKHLAMEKFPVALGALLKY